MLYLFLLPIFFAVLVVYFKIAAHYNIVDKPNERSSHKELTIRGGGIIYLIAAITAVCLDQTFWLTGLALLIIGTISFIDDRVTLSSKTRIVFHLLAVTLLFISLNLFSSFPLWAIVLLFIIVIGIINAYNFMDGINGITGTYSLVVLGGLQFVNYYVHPFVNRDLIWLPILASVVFLFFNFRIKAKCFAGDVGSITIALWIVFLLLSLVIKTNNVSYILFLGVYGIDSVFTIIHRLLIRQNIFDAHRLHFYQILANEQRMPHLLVAVIYAVIQLIIIFVVVFSGLGYFQLFLTAIVPLGVLYMLLKPKLMNPKVTSG